MYILEIPEQNKRREILLTIINRIFNRSFENIEDARIISSFQYIESSLLTKTDKISIKDIALFKKSLWLMGEGEIKLAIINNANNLTIEAQNSLLKDLEEEPEDSIIILSLRDKRLLIPTILSRGIHIKEGEIKLIHKNLEEEKFQDLVYNETKDLGNIAQFLNFSLFDKFLYINRNLSKKVKTKEASQKEDLVESFLIDLLSYYETLLESEKDNALERINLIENGLEKLKAGVNSRAVIEHIILTIDYGRQQGI